VAVYGVGLLIHRSYTTRRDTTKIDPNQCRRTRVAETYNRRLELSGTDDRRHPVMDVSPYLSNPARTLREACHETGRDAGGGNCIDCPLNDLCEKDAARRDDEGEIHRNDRESDPCGT
jgi:hypothetical protein